MKKGWEKRLLTSGFKPDWSIGYGEFLLQNAVWGIVVLGILGWVINHFFTFNSYFTIGDFVLLFTAGLAGSSLAYYSKHKKKK